MTPIFPDGPEQSDLDDIQDWADALGIEPSRVFDFDEDAFRAELGWRDAYHAVLQDAFNYAEEGGIENLVVFIWSKSQGRWYVFVRESN